MAAWYCQHVGLSIAHSIPDAPHTHFLADSSGTVLLEIYCNPADQVPVYADMDPLLLHIAFVSPDPDADTQALVAAGATLVQDLHLGDGSHVVMLRDPWGLALQLCRRAVSMLI